MDDASVDPRERGLFYEPRTPRPGRWMLERVGTARYRLTAEIEYLDRDGFTYEIPVDVEDNMTDFASIPWFLTWLVPRDGQHTPAAILHDAFIGGTRDGDYRTNRPEGVTDELADHLFREAMRYANVGIVRRWMMWTAVSLRTLWLNPNSNRAALSKVVPLFVVIVAWTLVAALVALDVPDFEQRTWHVPWFGDRPWYEELWHGLAVIVAGAAICSLLITAILRNRRAVLVGAISGLIVGFFALPMLVSAMGWGGYLILDNIVTGVFERRPVKPVILPAPDDTTDGGSAGSGTGADP